MMKGKRVLKVEVLLFELILKGEIVEGILRKSRKISFLSLIG
jgi:hypothetical protein